MMRAVAVPVGSRWAVAVDHGQHGGTGRQGYWSEDAAGGWGVSRRSARAAVDECSRPLLYRSRRAALEAADPLGEMEHAEEPPLAPPESAAARLLGARGGRAGTGQAKRRETSFDGASGAAAGSAGAGAAKRRSTEQYRAMAAKSAAARRAKKDATTP